MKTLDKTQLLYGPYKQPAIGAGGFLLCKVRGRVRVGGWSQGPISWPLEAQYGSFILCGDLVRAVEKEPAAAVAHHWGVGDATVTTWRKQLGIGRVNPGTHQLVSQIAHEIFAGRPKSEAFRQFMRRRIRRRIRNMEIPFVRPEQLWTDRERRLLGTALDEVVARKLGRSINSVKVMRARLGIPALPRYHRLKADEILLLGTKPDTQLAAQLGRTVKSIEYWRLKLRKPYLASKSKPWTRRELKLLGKHSDAEVARRLNRTQHAVQGKRVEIGIRIKSFKRWSAQETAILGKLTDEAVAQQTRRSLISVQSKRRLLGIPCKK